MPTTTAPRPTAAQARALHAALVHPEGRIPAGTHDRTVAVLYRHGWITDVTGTITDEGRTAVGEPTTAAVAAAAEQGAANRAAHTPGCRSWIDGDDYCDCAPITPATVVVGERPEGVTRGPAWRLSGGSPIVAQEEAAECEACSGTGTITVTGELPDGTPTGPRDTACPSCGLTAEESTVVAALVDARAANAPEDASVLAYLSGTDEEEEETDRVNAEEIAEETTPDVVVVCGSCGQGVWSWTNGEGVSLLVADDEWGGICGDSPNGEHAPAEDTVPVDDYVTPRTMVEYPGLGATEQGAPSGVRSLLGGAPVVALLVLVATVVGLLVNGVPGVSALVAHAAAPAPVVAPPAPVASSAPLLSSVGAPQRCEEDQPCWSCETMGNRVCGYGTAGGPMGTTARGVLDVWCPAGGSPVGLSGDAPLLPSSDVRVLLRTVGCRYGARESIMGGVPAHPNGVIHASGIDSLPIHASVYPMTSTQSPTPRADAREAARRLATRPALVAWENLTGDEDPTVIDAVCRAAANEARALLRPAP